MNATTAPLVDRLPRGVIAASCTPVGHDGRPDLARLRRHARRLRAEGCAGLLLGGSTGEGLAFTLADRRELLTWAASELPGFPILASTGAPSIGDAASLTRHAIEAGAIPLVLPPPVSGPVDDEGVIEWFLRVIEGTDRADCEIVLYNLPELTHVTLSPALVERLVARAGPSIIGLKDSSGNLRYLREIRERTPALQLYVGHEPALVEAVDLGASGALCGMANILAPLLVETFGAARDGDIAAASEGRAAITRAWNILDRHQPFPSAFKALIALRDADPEWTRTMPPLRGMADDAARALAAELGDVP